VFNELHFTVKLFLRSSAQLSTYQKRQSATSRRSSWVSSLGGTTAHEKIKALPLGRLQALETTQPKRVFWIRGNPYKILTWPKQNRL